ncbi:MAG: GH92 family glycosyl hydrolase [Chloroflexota bacterium]
MLKTPRPDTCQIAILCLLCLILTSSFIFQSQPSLSVHAESITDYVDPFIGTGGDGNTVPGALVPWGMVYVSPDTTVQHASGYKKGDPHILGFSQLHGSGLGCTELGNILVMPTVGNIATTEVGYQSSYDSEIATPGYYKVHLSTPNVTAEMTATTRVSFSKYTFPERSGDANIIIDVAHTIAPDVDSAYVSIVSNDEIDGWVKSGDFCGAHNLETIHFAARFSKAALSSGTWGTESSDKATTTPQKPQAGAYFRFATTANEAITVKIGISFVSVTNARLNLDTELPDGTTFDQVKAEASNVWAAELGKIAVTGGTDEQKKIFYTSLYHMLIDPAVFSDVNGEYQGINETGVKKTDYTRYHIFATWDQYRNLHPLLALVYPEREIDMVKSMVGMYKEGGWLPKWEIGGNETRNMIGDSGVPIIVDAYMKGLKDFDVKAAYDGMVKSATEPANNQIRSALQKYLDYGYIPQNDTGGAYVWGTASTALEYYYDDWNIAQLAKALGNTGPGSDYETFLARSLNYKKLYDPAVGFIRPKNADGSWLTPFDPNSLCCDQSWQGSGGPGYAEGNAWQYTFAVHHDIAGLKALMGGDAKFTDKLQQTFDNKQYVAWNEPDFTYTYLFDFVAGQAWRTQKQVRLDLATHFDTTPAGLPGNDDTGATSGLYVFGAIGIYPVAPTTNRYQIGSPIFDSVTIQLNPAFYPGKQFVIKTANNSETNLYIQSAALNGNPYGSAYLLHSAIIRGGTFVLKMGSLPSTWGGVAVPIALQK